jgi:hypothetical protein
LTEKGVFLTPVLEMPALITMLFVNPFSKKKLKFAATGLRKDELRMRDLLKIKDLLVNNKIKTVIDKVYSLEQMKEAHEYVDSGRKRGNVIVKNRLIKHHLTPKKRNMKTILIAIGIMALNLSFGAHNPTIKTEIEEKVQPDLSQFSFKRRS